MTDTPFRQLHHICFVVHDLDKSVAYYESLGVGPWQDYPPLTEFTDLDVPNPDAFHALRYKFVNLDNVQLQLCQPPQLDCPQRRFLDAHGEGVFHIGFESDVGHRRTAGRSARAAGQHARPASQRIRLRLLRHPRPGRRRPHGPANRELIMHGHVRGGASVRW